MTPTTVEAAMDDNVSSQQVARGHRLAKASLVCGILGFSLWLLSYSWVPFALTGHQAGELVGYVVKVSEVGGLLVGLVSVGSGFLARRRSQAGSPERRWASRGLAMGAVVLVLIVGFNLLGLVFHL
jgi:hypothetical protein